MNRKAFSSPKRAMPRKFSRSLNWGIANQLAVQHKLVWLVATWKLLQQLTFRPQRGSSDISEVLLAFSSQPLFSISQWDTVTTIRLSM
ncbi:hypothetical protein V2J09_003710 [Rumex salicifolius]